MVVKNGDASHGIRKKITNKNKSKRVKQLNSDRKKTVEEDTTKNSWGKGEMELLSLKDFL